MSAFRLILSTRRVSMLWLLLMTRILLGVTLITPQATTTTVVETKVDVVTPLPLTPPPPPTNGDSGPGIDPMGG
jgi:hypothetical protein